MHLESLSLRRYPRSPSIRGRPRQISRHLHKHLEITWNEIYRLNHYMEIFIQFIDIIERSSVRNEKSHFWDFIHRATVDELIHRLDRICERQWKNPKKRVLSLGAFLDELEPQAHLVTREYYVGVRPNTVQAATKKGQRKHPYHWIIANKQFDKFVGKTKSSLTPADVKRDRGKIRRAVGKITRYRNKQLAHIAFDRARYSGPSIADVLSAISVVTEVTHKYSLLIFNWSSPNLSTVDITGIFTKAWLDDASRADVMRLVQSRRNIKPIKVTPV